MVTRVAHLALAAACLATLALPPWADALTGTVVTPRGAAAPTRIQLSRPGAPPISVPVERDPADPSGRTARFDAEVPPGTYTVTADGFAGRRVTVTPGTTSVTVPLLPIAPWMVQNPGVLGAFGLGLGYDGLWIGNLEKTGDRTTVTDRDPAGNVVGEASSAADLDAINRTFKKPFDLNGVFLDVPVGLGSLDAGSVTVYPAVVLTLGWYDFEFEPRDRQTGLRTTFSGDGVMLGGGFEILASRTPWFAAMSFLYRSNLDTSVDRSPGIPPPPGGTVAQDGDLDFEQVLLALRFGRTFLTGWRYLGAVAPFVGVEGSWTDVSLDTRVVGMFPGGATRTFRFQDELEGDAWRGLVGVDAHVTDGLFARLQLAFDDCDQALLMKVVYRFDALPLPR